MYNNAYNRDDATFESLVNELNAFLYSDGTNVHNLYTMIVARAYGLAKNKEDKFRLYMASKTSTNLRGSTLDKIADASKYEANLDIQRQASPTPSRDYDSFVGASNGGMRSGRYSRPSYWNNN